MTACNIIHEADAIYIFTDGASYHSDGTLGAVAQKVWPLAHLNCALVCRGPHVLMPALIGDAGTIFASFDELTAGIVPLAMATYARHKDALDLCSIGPDFDLFIAGWSEARGQPETYVVCSHGTSVEAWSLVPLGPVAIAPFNGDLAEWAAINLERLQALDDPNAMGLELMEAQRGLKGQHAGTGEQIRGVGGFCQVTRITPRSILTGILRRWPDEIGEPLGIEVMDLAKRNTASQTSTSPQTAGAA